MNPTQARQQEIDSSEKLLKKIPQQPEIQERTFGQKLADSMATKVGSWAFLIGQTTVLTAWVGTNLTPGLPHWDESPFILLNLVFSFASAYTAPIVLMSQNRQSDEDRKQSAHNHQVNLQTAHNIELLHQKIDELQSQNLSRLLELIKQQQVNQTVESNLEKIKTSQEISLVPSLNLVYLNGENFKPQPKLSTLTNITSTFYQHQTKSDNHRSN
ncbi:MAG: DUF1003 domain-containing protein [Hydrococcus sp. Prado102]|jgi:uncharacterized membrane protein|nr:DUF1003 domain-containing protein [Hydrococcus sp. Prado102]